MESMNLFLIILIVLFATVAAAKKEYSISMNSEFNPDLKKHPHKIKAKLGEWLELTCPQYDIEAPSDKMELFYLYFLEEKPYRNCDLDDETVVLNCSSPYHETKLTVKFQMQTPYPLGFTFKGGRTYYYVGVPVGEKNCENAFRIEVEIEKDGPVVPPVEPVPTTTTTTTTTKSTTTKRLKFHTKKPRKEVTPAARQDGGPDGNNAPSVRCVTFMTSILALITFWGNL